MKVQTRFEQRSDAAAVMRGLANAGVIVDSRLSAGDISRGGQLVWPVVPRRRVTAIHRAQTEVVQLLVGVGWTVKLLIADCASPGKIDPHVEPRGFCKDLTAYCASRGFDLGEAVYLSEMWAPRHHTYARMQHYLKMMTCDLTLDDVRRMNTKGYAKSEEPEIESRSTLDNMRPALSAAAVLAMNRKSPTLVIAGYDEEFQWRKTLAVAEAGRSIHTILIPQLMVDREHQVRQRNMFPSWDSLDQLLEQIETDGQSNLASWLFHMLCYLPRFPVKSVEFPGGGQVAPDEWPLNEPNVPCDNVAKAEVARLAWPLLGPTLAKSDLDRLLDEDLAQQDIVESPGLLSKVRPIKVLFVAADPEDATRLRLGGEHRAIAASIRAGRNRDDIALQEPILSARTEDISRALIDTQPAIVHFSGHGSSAGHLCFENADGKLHEVTAAALAKLISNFEGVVHCVILNACYSGKHADALAKHVPFVVGMNDSIPDDAATAYSVGFYQALASGLSIPKAHALGVAQVAMNRDGDESIIELIQR